MAESSCGATLKSVLAVALLAWASSLPAQEPPKKVTPPSGPKEQKPADEERAKPTVPDGLKVPRDQPPMTRPALQQANGDAPPQFREVGSDPREKGMAKAGVKEDGPEAKKETKRTEARDRSKPKRRDVDG